jgi:hypothetical protein
MSQAVVVRPELVAEVKYLTGDNFCARSSTKDCARTSQQLRSGA